MRDDLFYFVMKKMHVNEYCILPKWAFILRFLLFPLDTFYWKMSKSRGYDMERDVWVMDGIIISRRFLICLSKSHNFKCEVSKIGDEIVLKEIVEVDNGKTA